MAEEVKESVQQAPEVEAAEQTETNTGSAFSPIETQEDFDQAIKSRIERAKASVRKEFEGFDTYKAKAESYDADTQALKAQIKDLEKKVGEYETISEKKAIAKECGLPEALAQRLTGSDPDAWRKDAKELKQIFGSKEPSRSSENLSANSDNMDLLRALRGS